MNHAAEYISKKGEKYSQDRQIPDLSSKLEESEFLFYKLDTHDCNPAMIA